MSFTPSSHDFVVRLLLPKVMCHGQALEALAKNLEMLDKHLGVLVNHNRVVRNNYFHCQTPRSHDFIIVEVLFGKTNMSWLIIGGSNFQVVRNVR